MDNEDLVHKSEEDTKTEFLDGIPKEVRRVIQSTTSFMGMTGSRESSIEKKITPEHIDKMLDNERIGMQLQAKDEKNHRYFLFGIVLVLAVLAVFVLILFRSQPEMISQIVIPMITGIVGAAGGYGYGKSKRGE